VLSAQYNPLPFIHLPIELRTVIYEMASTVSTSGVPSTVEPPVMDTTSNIKPNVTDYMGGPCVDSKQKILHWVDIALLAISVYYLIFANMDVHDFQGTKVEKRLTLGIPLALTLGSCVVGYMITSCDNYDTESFFQYLIFWALKLIMVWQPQYSALLSRVDWEFWNDIPAVYRWTRRNVLL